nr:unnamed protein product [Digitaria exilis]
MAEGVAGELLRRLERDEIPVEVAGAQLLKPPRRARLRRGCVADAWDSTPVGARSSSFYLPYCREKHGGDERLHGEGVAEEQLGDELLLLVVLLACGDNCS